jgi:mono/diheme cytochrome c family protein
VNLVKKHYFTFRMEVAMKTARGVFLAVLALIISTVGEAQAQSAVEGKKLYTSYCTSCHGDDGKGDGVAGRSLPVKPADHTNGSVMNQLSDRFLNDIITKGGSGVKKSAFMPAWGGALNSQQISDIVAYLRSIANPPYKSQKAGTK